jgi:hypothetical protein
MCLGRKIALPALGWHLGGSVSDLKATFRDAMLLTRNRSRRDPSGGRAQARAKSTD